MKPFEIMRYLRKYHTIIAILSIATGVFFYVFVQLFFQKYVATTVIEYVNENGEPGKTSDGEKIDTSEIYASNIISKVMKNLRLNTDEVNMDTLRGGISIEPLIEEEELKIFDAKIEQGEDYEILPTRYMISFSSGAIKGKEYPREVLNEILDEYSVFYGENHVNSSGGANAINDIYEKDYDYIEMMEVIEQSLASTLQLLESKMNMNAAYRSYTTGYSFLDLYQEFALLNDITVPQIKADILMEKVTKDRNVLLAKYANRNNTLAISNSTSSEEIEKITDIIYSYVTMMSESDNTNITYEYILDQIYDNYYYDESTQSWAGNEKTTEYDILMNRYVRNRTEYENNVIDIAYNQYILDIFSGAPAESPAAVQQETEARIRSFAEQVNSLYRILDETNDEFNEYLGAANIQVLASVGVTEKIPILLFVSFVVVFFAVVGCAGAVTIGRVGDIVEYHAYTNKIDGLPNRARCDGYIADMEQRVLPARFACIAFKLANLQSVSNIGGRQSGDRMMKIFAATLTSVFVPSGKVFVGYNGSGMYLAFVEGLDSSQIEAAVSQITTVAAQKCENESFTMELESGFALSADEECYHIRKLLSIVMGKISKKNGSAKWNDKDQADQEVALTREVDDEEIPEDE